LRRLRRPHWAAILFGGTWAAVAAASAQSPSDNAPLPATIEYNRDIRQVLSNTCLKCHGPDTKGNPSGLRLDQREFAVSPHTGKSGRTTVAIVPGKPEQSELWRRISSTDPETVMPPRDALHQLTPRNRATIERWIEQGAVFQPHWAYLPPVKGQLPVVEPGKRESPLTNPIDRFIRADLASRGISPSPAAPSRTLVRRLSLDLTGLPPTPDETESFVSDKRNDAYERVVDRLLASSHYGERMAVPWLDLVRFADSTGLHGDQLFNNFPYRDYVIDAFNRNLPFDRFTVEQLAGDLLANATVEQRVASGFNRLNMVTREGGAQTGEYLAKSAADRVRTVSTAWLGSTLACAECHDHKYDPFSIKDFYAFAAYFADVKQWGVYRHFIYTPEPELALHTDDYPFPPEIRVESAYLQQRDARLRARFETAQTAAGRAQLARPEGADAVRAWARQAAPFVAADPGAWAATRSESVVNNNEVVSVPLEDGSVRFENPAGYREKKYSRKATRHELTLPAPGVPLSRVRLEVLPDDTHGGFVTRDRLALFEIAVTLSVQRKGQTQAQPLEVAEAFAECETENYFNGRARVSLRELWRSSTRLAQTPQSAIFQLRRPLTLGPDDRLIASIATAPVNFHQRDYVGEVGRVRLSVSPLGSGAPGEDLPAFDRAAFAAVAPDPRQLDRLSSLYAQATTQYAIEATAELLREILECNRGLASTMVTVAAEPRMTRVLARGNWQDTTGEIVAPAPPHFLPGGTLAAGSPRSTRLDLARWIASTTNPLTARTFVNRLWQQFFGTGLSSAVEDLGTQGEYPTHPELLDWLSADFMESGWNVKALVKLIVTSETYRQASRERPELREVDPQNRLLARQSARRLDAEFVRDNALFASGLLTPDIGGPSATPYQPAGYYEQLNFPLRDYVAERDDRQYRRGLYSHWQRTFLHPMLANFDAPSREECTAARNVSTTPQQALTLLNDPSFVEAARALAERVMPAPSSDRLTLAFQYVLGRPPSTRERSSMERFHASQLAAFKERPADARTFTSIGNRPVPAGLDRVELAAWTAVGRALLNLNETIVRY